MKTSFVMYCDSMQRVSICFVVISKSESRNAECSVGKLRHLLCLVARVDCLVLGAFRGFGKEASALLSFFGRGVCYLFVVCWCMCFAHVCVHVGIDDDHRRRLPIANGIGRRLNIES